MDKAKIRRWMPLAVFFAVFVALWLMYAIVYRYHFYHWEQNRIFLLTPQWIASYFEKPAWLADLSGEFLTQFYYYVGAGPVILGAVITITSAVFYTCIWGRGWLRWILTAALYLLMVSCSFATSCHLNAFMAVLIGLVCYIGVRHAGVWSVAVLPVAWWMAGYGVFFTAALIIARSFRRGVRSAAITTVIAVILTAGVPWVLKGIYTLPYLSALTWPGIPSPVMPESEFESVLSVDNEYYFGNYEAAIANARGIESPNSVTAFYYYLAQARKDSLPDHLLDYPVKQLGTLVTISEDTPMPVINMINDLYYELGDMMYAERAAMMRNVFSSQNRNARMVKRLAEINLVTGDTAAAMKYIRVLSHTIPYVGWAASHNPGRMSPEARTEIERRRALINSRDTLRLGDNCRVILEELLESNPDNTLALDYLLCTDLLLKDMDSFKTDYDRYCMSVGKPRIRPLYQQALMIYLAGTDASQEEWSRYIVSPDEYNRFQTYSRQRRDPAFADTYWYYFDTAEI